MVLHDCEKCGFEEESSKPPVMRILGEKHDDMMMTIREDDNGEWLECPKCGHQFYFYYGF